jgi:hypothetical protein
LTLKIWLCEKELLTSATSATRGAMEVSALPGLKKMRKYEREIEEDTPVFITQMAPICCQEVRNHD